MKDYKRYAVGLLISALLLFVLARSSEATLYTFQSYDSGSPRNDMNDLDHYYYYSWKINWNLPAGEVITGARLNISNIWDWKEEADILRIYLLDSPPVLDNKKTHTFPTYTTVLSNRYDDQKKDNFYGKGPLVGTWSDPYGGNNGLNKVPDLVFTLPVSDPVLADLTDLTNFITSTSIGIWGFGIDPDCHYFNDGITFTIETMAEPVPEPATLLLTGGGLVSVLLIRRRFNG